MKWYEVLLIITIVLVVMAVMFLAMELTTQFIIFLLNKVIDLIFFE